MDWTQVLLAMFVAIPPTLAALATLFSSIRNARKVDELHVVVNSRLTQLLESTASSSSAEGELRGRDAEAKRDKATHAAKPAPKAG